MEHRRIDTIFGLAVIAFLAIIILVTNNFNSKRLSDQKDHEAAMSNLVQRKNDKIKLIASQLIAKQQELDSVQQTLANTKSDLDIVNRRLTESGSLPAAAAQSASY